MVRIRLYASEGHAANPQVAVDAAMVAASILVQMPDLADRVSREGRGFASIHADEIHAGAAGTDWVAHADIVLDVKAYDATIRKQLHAGIHSIVQGEAAASGAAQKPEITTAVRAPPTTNDAALAAHVGGASRRFFGRDKVLDSLPQHPCEDFSVLATADIPINHSPFNMPLLHPTLETGIHALSFAMLSIVGNASNAGSYVLLPVLPWERLAIPVQVRARVLAADALNNLHHAGNGFVHIVAGAKVGQLGSNVARTQSDRRNVAAVPLEFLGQSDGHHIEGNLGHAVGEVFALAHCRASVSFETDDLEWLSDPRKQLTQAAAAAAADAAGGAEFAKWLLIFDNVDEITMLDPFWPAGPHGSILITSRDPLTKTDLATRGVDVPPMSEVECVLMLCTEVDELPTKPATKEAALALVRPVGRLPLAIAQCAARIRRTDTSIEEYMNRFGRGDLMNELKKVQVLPPQQQYKHVLDTVWRFERFSAPALGLFHVLAFFDPDSVSERILEVDAAVEAEPDGVPCAYPKPGEEYDNTRVEIMRTSLVNRNKETRSLSWHRMVQKAVRSKMSAVDAQRAYQLAVHLLHQAWEYAEDRFSRESRKRPACDEVVPHVLTMMRAYGAAVRGRPLALPSARRLVVLLQETGYYLILSAQHGAVDKILDLAIGICEAYGDDMRDLLANTKFSYARFGGETNMDPKRVLGYCMDYHTIRKALDDGSLESREDVASSHTSLAQGYLFLDQFEAALEHCQTCIAIEAALPGHEGVLSQFAHIYRAWALYGLQRDEEAAKLSMVVIQYRTTKFGQDDMESVKWDEEDVLTVGLEPRLGLALHCLANARRRQGRILASFKAYQKAWANYRATEGPDTWRLAQIDLKLAEIYVTQPNIPGTAELAKEHFDRAIKAFGRSPFHKNELARALYRHALSLGELKTPLGPQPTYEKAKGLYYGLRPEASRETPPGEAEFDSLVRFWSR
ncbi:uncharacterized protein SPSK_02194 [Sporothrix schenckii 1099-18]|uniref:DUF7779 domain-containing protein n=1 Tax=Sporothrix schenckii 1099-18 TaxID=1397361 RepID=A0A0F2MCG5_SPOSC|nr:uncharacterized protein SPSK_02194 [Sporothrix schenckii 1099-18]KJR86769.1 hypothetical protein SPSK_02194 [Sporothrix schenckii 1099-18]